MGETERIALEAGTVWWDGELFSGKPDWRRLLSFRPQALSEKERAFLDGPVEELCRRLDDWQVWQDRDLPEEVWDFLKRERFFGMLKRERINRRRYQSHAEARADIFDYIECFYNPRRRRKMEALKQKESNLTQPSVETG